MIPLEAKSSRKVPVIVFIALCFGVAPSVFSAEKIVTLDNRLFPGLAEMDGNWAALKVAHDGRVYAGLACY